MSREKQPETVASVWGLRCPHCRSDEHLLITVAAWARLYVDGPQADTALQWYGDSACLCLSCNPEAKLAEGTVADFQVEIS